MSWGLHFNNNLFNLLVIGTTGDILKSAAPLQFDPPSLAVTTVIILAQSVLTFPVLALLVRRHATAGEPGSRGSIHA